MFCVETCRHAFDLKIELDESLCRSNLYIIRHDLARYFPLNRFNLFIDYYDAFTMRSFAPPSSQTMRRQEPNARRRQKYSASRAFYITILIISILSIWGLLRNSNGHGSGGKNNQILRRSDFFDGITVHGENNKLKSRDLEARIPFQLQCLVLTRKLNLVS